MISLENLKKFLELQQKDILENLIPIASTNNILGSIFDTMMFPDYDNAINLVDVNRRLNQDLNFDYEFTENGYFFLSLMVK